MGAIRGPNAPSFELRRARLEDGPAIALIHQRASRAGYHGLVEDRLLEERSLEERKTRWRDCIAAGALSTQVAVLPPGAVLGFVALGVEPPFGDEDERVSAVATRRDAGAIITL